MTNQTQATLGGKDTLNGGVLYMAIEMGEAKWKLMFSDGSVKPNGHIRIHAKTIEGSNYMELGEAIKKAKQRLKLAAAMPVVSCYEAGQEGFWPQRRMEEMGIDNRVIDSASIEVNRRYRRTKTDKLDVRKLLE
ncbi:MAG: hypothetical protein GY807_04265 [Gammaproteobacteria bacterium]|nr:hypothetical protein [Gammaproteobacteria bacterium]